MSELLEDALRRKMAEPDRPTAKPFRLQTVRGKLVIPDLDLDRTSALVAADDEAEYRKRD